MHRENVIQLQKENICILSRYLIYVVQSEMSKRMAVEILSFVAL